MEGATAGGLVQLIPFIAMAAIFYFLIFAPMRKRQKALQSTIANLKKGDAVITQGGLYGEVSAIKDDSLVLKLGENVKVTVAKSAIAGLQGQEKGAQS